MGPRARARGNTRPIKSILKLGLLQWGRARALAETSRKRSRRCCGRRLQWGRERALAETAVSVTTELSKSQQPFSERVRNTGPASMRGDGKASHKQETT